MDVLAQKGWICHICYTTKTRAGICRECFATIQSDVHLSIEVLTSRVLMYFFGEGIKFNFGTLIGGTSCSKQVDGNRDCNGLKTKGAYVDIPLILEDRVIYIEVDENSHRYYDVTCELARYDTLSYGTNQSGKHVDIIRFNPHQTSSVKVDLTPRLKCLVQLIRNLMTQQLFDDVATALHNMFYGLGSPHIEAAKRAVGTIRICNNIDNVDNVNLDKDIDEFKLDVLMDDLDQHISESVVQNWIGNSSSQYQCHAINYFQNVKKRKRCSQGSAKNSHLCSRHSKMNLSGKKINLYDE